MPSMANALFLATNLLLTAYSTPSLRLKTGRCSARVGRGAAWLSRAPAPQLRPQRRTMTHKDRIDLVLQILMVAIHGQ